LQAATGSVSERAETLASEIMQVGVGDHSPHPRNSRRHFNNSRLLCVGEVGDPNGNGELSMHELTVYLKGTPYQPFAR